MHLGVTVEGKGRIIRPSGGADFSQSYDVAVVGLGTAGAPAFSFGSRFACWRLVKLKLWEGLMKGIKYFSTPPKTA